MPLINHDIKDINHLEQLIIKTDGSSLVGEIDMYRRMVKDCQNSDVLWHFWHDLRLPIPCDNKSHIQIDFLLICKYGALVIEVKGGGISLIEGKYYYVKNGKESLMGQNPFKQVDDYKWSLINNNILNKDQIYVESIVAFPHSSLNRTNANSQLDNSWQLWSQNNQSNTSLSFADFCIEVLNKSQNKRNLHSLFPLEKKQLDQLVNKLLPTFKERNPYTEANLQSILDWLNIDNICTLESLSHNNRIVIQGGAGTGKTTIAKAYIKKYSYLKGLYFCWNIFLAKKIAKDLTDENLTNCEVFQLQKFLLKKQIGRNVSFDDFKNPSVDDYNKIVQRVVFSMKENSHFVCYDYLIIDEAQDIFDKGVDIILNELVSIRGKGLKDGKFLVFYDTEQAYNNDGRNLSDYADYISLYAAHFKLNENKRVPSNKEIVQYANCVLALSNEDSIRIVLDDIAHRKNIAVCTYRFGNTKELIKHLRIKINKIKVSEINGKDYILLGHSNLQYLKSENGETIFQRLAGIESIEDLNENNINSLSPKVLPFTTILRFKGLESKNVILIIKDSALLDKYEMYIGMTRAIMSLEILILE